MFYITDDKLVDKRVNPLDNYWNDDSVEIFIDENKSGGDHWHNTNAFAYHVNLAGQAVDYTNGDTVRQLSCDTNGQNCGTEKTRHMRVWRADLAESTGAYRHVWLIRLSVFNDQYRDDIVNTPVTLFAGKQMGFAVAYNDDDSGNRDNMIGSVDTAIMRNNEGFKNASGFGVLTLLQ